jgi:hypothetical protein
MGIIGKNLSYDPLDFNPDKLSQSTKLSEYAFPIIAVLSFILILLFLTIPSINKLFEFYDQRDAASLQLEEKKSELADLQELRNMNQTNKEILSRLQRIIPTSQTEVVNFVSKVEQISKETVVEFRDPLAGERLIVDSSSQAPRNSADDKNLKLIQIPVTFSLLGNLDNLRSLLGKIYNNNDFIVMTKMQLDNRATDESTGAKMELELSKYQYSKPISEDDYKALLQSVSFSERPDQEVIDFIRRKTEISNNNETVNDLQASPTPVSSPSITPSL